MLSFALSLFLTEPAPLDMPRAEAFLVEEKGRFRLEDRYDRLDLWTSQTVVGRWVDDVGRIFVLADLGTEPPTGNEAPTLTRLNYAASRSPMPRIRANHDMPCAFRRAIEFLADTPLTEEVPLRSRQLPHGYADVTYWQHPTNMSSVVCTFRPEKSERWWLAVWALAEGDDLAERTQLFEDEFLRKEFPDFRSSQSSQPSQPSQRSQRKHPVSERDLLRADARHSVAAYPTWHVADAAEFTVLDDALSRELVATLTNEVADVRARAAAALPTSIDGSNVLSVARIYASRAEYLSALETDGNTNMMWTAAYWSQLRRELVAFLPDKGEAEFLKTIRHESFHQYLSYAVSMIPVSPWLNEGYAQYFEDVENENWGKAIDVSDEGLKRLAQAVPAVLGMDYEAFYAGTDAERHVKYRLAWSLAVFLEKGANEVRLQPFATLKRDYFAELFKTRDMCAATAKAFGSQDKLKLFIAEWMKFWKNR